VASERLLAGSLLERTGAYWSVLDHHSFGKAGYYYVRRAYSPILASFKQLPEGAVELWITNDTLSRVTDTVWLETFAGEKIWEESCQVEIGPNDRAAWCGAGELVG
jgi:beta-mannosidase